MLNPSSFQDFPIRAGFCDAKESAQQTPPFLMKQVHSADVLVVTQNLDSPPTCDALATKEKNVQLTIKTADCAPVLFIDPIARVVGAAHAGWKGAFQGILENTLITMIKLGADISQIYTAIGPHLTQQSFQVSQDMQSLFPLTEQHFFHNTDQGVYFDFTGYLVHRLTRAGVKHIETLALDTYTNPDYNSHRRDPESHSRQYSFIELL